MKLIEQLPYLSVSSDEEILESLPLAYFYSLLPQIAEYYNSNLKMSAVLRTKGIYVEEGVEQQQIQCPIPNHGEDIHPSCRYYRRDRATEKIHELIYCFKCNQAHTSFSLVYTIQKALGQRYNQILLYIRNKFGIPIPKDIIFNFDIGRLGSLPRRSGCLGHQQ